MIAALTRRHVQVFFRDPTAVALSLLSALVLFLLYGVFLGGMQRDALTELVPAASPGQVSAYINSWMFAGVVMISTMTTSLSALTVFVADRESNRFRDFLVSPITRFQLTMSYLLAAFVASLAMSTLVLVVSQVYLTVADGAALGVVSLLTVFLEVVVFCLVFAGIWSFVITFVSSTSMFMSVGTIVGTAGGFLCGAFVTVGSLPGPVVQTMNLLPFNQAATLMRQEFTLRAGEDLAGGDSATTLALQREYGTVVTLGDQQVADALVLLLFLVLFGVFVALGTWRIGRRIA